MKFWVIYLGAALALTGALFAFTGVAEPFAGAVVVTLMVATMIGAFRICEGEWP